MPSAARSFLCSLPVALCVAGLGAFASPASAQPARAASRFAKDYSNVRGFNYTASHARGYAAQWQQYSHDVVDREMGYAQKLNLNLARVFLAYAAWQADNAGSNASVRDSIRTADSHGISTMLIFVDMPGFLPDLFEESAKPKLRAWVKDVVDAVGNEPGLAFWDAHNEPDLVRIPSVPPNTNQRQRTAVARFVASTLKELDPRTPVTIGCLYLSCTEETADVVDVLSYHDYSQTRAQMAADIARAQKLSAKLGKPIIATEIGCTGRANPYDIDIEEHDKARMGWVIWELMIAHNWAPIHGVFYPDGTVRDPSIAAAILGVFRNRGADLVLEEPDREGILSGAIEDANAWLKAPTPVWFDGLVVAETEANLLEANELVGLRELPTRKVDLLRAGPSDISALRKLIEEFTAALTPFKTPGMAPAHRYYVPEVPH
jgi:hypothetical protein